MKILVACEESQKVTMEMRARGHEAYSCDLIDCSGNHPEWHIKGDALTLINGDCEFETVDGTQHKVEGKWDMLIAFPPCTYLTVTGNRWFNVERYGDKAIQRLKDREFGKWFFMQFVNADCERIAIENPIGVMSTEYRKPDQIIHPWMFGDNVTKATCLWLKNLQKLIPIVNEKPEVEYKEWISKDGKKKRQAKWYFDALNLPPAERAKARSKTFDGIAKAMAETWA